MLKGSKRISLGAVFTALCVVLCTGGAFLESLDLSLAAVAGVLVYIYLLEFSAKSSLAVWAAASLLSLLIFPVNTASWMFLLFAGWYPALKHRVRSLPKPWAWAIKLMGFNLGLLLYGAVALFLLQLAPQGAWWYALALAAGANLVFVLYDIALDRFMLYYALHLRKRLGLKK